jgi:flotillin
VLVGYLLEISDIDISKKAFQLPFQTSSVINMEPGTYHSLIEAMSKEKIAFKMPTVFTIGPKDEQSFLTRYAKLLNQSSYEEVKQTINGVVQGEGRILAAGLPLEELFNSRHHFKTEVTDKINEELSKFGLVVYNANIEELSDMEGNEYFSYLRKRALEGAINKARVDVAEQKRFGDTGEKEHEGETRQKVSQIEKEAKLVENQRQKDISESNAVLSVAQAEYDRQVRIAKAEADAAAQKKMFELQGVVEETRRKQETEKRRANELTAAKVQAEVDVMAAEGKANALRIEAEAKLYSEQKKADGIFAQREAEAQGLAKLVESAGGVDKLTQYLMVHNDILPKLAREQANALQGLNPDIHVWQTGNSGDGVKGLSGTLTDMFRTGMPLFDGIKKQTGVDFLKTFREPELPVPQTDSSGFQTDSSGFQTDLSGFQTDSSDLKK